MATYTQSFVEKILRNYLDIRNTLEGNAQRLHEKHCEVKRPNFDQRLRRERAFGQTDQRWPFMEPSHATPPRDGKAKARAMEDLHCAVIDLETAFPRLSLEDQELLLRYFVYQEQSNYDELAEELGLVTRSAAQKRTAKAVQRLTREMEVCQTKYLKHNNTEQS